MRHLGGIFAFSAPVYGSLDDDTNNPYPVVAMAPRPQGDGYWMLRSNGEVHGFPPSIMDQITGTDITDVRHLTLHRPMNGIVPTSTGRGYWTVASDGMFLGKPWMRRGDADTHAKKHVIIPRKKSF